MNSRIKKIIIWILSVISILTLVSCKTNNPADDKPGAVPTEEPAEEISYYSVIIGSSTGSNYIDSSTSLKEEISYDSENDFNNYQLTYTSDNHFKGTITYTVDGQNTSEIFYLEPGENVLFTGLIDGYLDGKMATYISSIEFSAFKGKKCNFELLKLATDIKAVPESEFIYIQNDKFKFGVDLSMGGGVCYFEDLQDNDDSIGNLLNRADEGRLIQQSYYGDSSAPYKPAKYNGSTWSYNPVQGGDQHRNRSKIVDFRLEADSIYIKCIPMDWAQNGSPAQCYMENTYVFKDGYVEVDNRFIDYSGYMIKNSPHQELPAVYVISYLDTFHYYSGTSPWTNDKLTVKANLPFWGGNSNAYFRFRSGNDEKWCAWTNSDGYGFGIYTPIAEQLLAGRFSYNASKEPTNGATNYVAPLITAQMGAYKVFEYNYYITTGNLQDIRDTFTNVYNANEK